MSNKMSNKQHKRRNPVAAAPILKKGGVHQKSKTAARSQARQQLKREAASCFSEPENNQLGGYPPAFYIPFHRFNEFRCEPALYSQ